MTCPGDVPMIEDVTSGEPDAAGRKVWAAALALAAERGWEVISLPDIAERAGLSFQEIYRIAPTKLHVLALFEDHVNQALLERLTATEDSESVRDRLFDLILERLDLLAPYRTALASIGPGLARDPVAALTLRPQAADMARLFLGASGLDAGGLKGKLRAAAVILLWAQTLRDWLGDEDPGLAVTMAKLDRRLRRLERLAQEADRLW